MVPDISRGSRTRGLLVYLYGPGRRDEHVDPHQVASWDGFAPDPGRDPDATLTQLARALDLRVEQLGDRAPPRHVWHCSVRTAPEDRPLSDTEWGQVAHRIVHATGIAPDGDLDGCRWIAVRHAADHIHIVATMARGDLRQPRNAYDYPRAQTECRRMERELDLRRLHAGDGTAAKRPTSAEMAKAERTGRQQTPRETLREAVRQAVAGAATEEEFFARLRLSGLDIKQRSAPSGDVIGYAVALPGDLNKNGKPVWFPGSKLAPDLSLPKIRQRLTTCPLEPGAPARRLTPAAARRQAAAATDQAVREFLPGGNDKGVAAQLRGMGEVLDALALTTPAPTFEVVRQAARNFERATRWHTTAAVADSRALRAAARGILSAGTARVHGEDGGTAATLLSSLLLAVTVAARWHTVRGRAQQGAAARQAAVLLLVAYTEAAQPPIRALRERGRRLSPPVRARYASAVRSVLPDYAVIMQAGVNWAALTATLEEIERAGHDPVTLLKEAVRMRELQSADSITDVVVWRLRRLAKLPSGAGTGARQHVLPVKAPMGKPPPSANLDNVRGYRPSHRR